MRRKLLWCGLAIAALAIAGCSSSASTAGGGGNSASESPDSDTLAAARSVVADAAKTPTAIPITQALTAKPPTGKTVVYLQCEVAQCALEGKGIESAAAALGWNYKTLNFQAANPATLVTALTTALQYNPTAVYFAGVPQSLWESVIPKYRSAGAYIIPSSVPDVKLDDVVVTSLGANALYAQAGKLLADQVAVDSKGRAKVLFATVPSYTIFKPLQTAFTAELKQVCPGCSSDTFEATVPQVTSNQMVPAIVSALKRSPDIDYVVSSNGDFVQTLPSALTTAGISSSKVTIVTFSGTSAVQQLVKSGQIASTTGFGYSYEGWLGVDAALRAMQKLPLGEEHQLLPLPLLTKDNISTPADSVDLPADYQAQFKRLWHLAG